MKMDTTTYYKNRKESGNYCNRIQCLSRGTWDPRGRRARLRVPKTSGPKGLLIDLIQLWPNQGLKHPLGDRRALNQGLRLGVGDA